MLNTLFLKEYGRNKEENDTFNIESIIKAAKTDDYNCILISEFPTFVIEDPNGNYCIKEL